MTWVRKVHVCRKPNRDTTSVHVGDVWRCDDCGQHWKVSILGWIKVAPFGERPAIAHDLDAEAAS